MIVIDQEKFSAAMRARGYESISGLARALGIHRNTVHYYLSGQPVVPEALEKICNALNVQPGDIFVRKGLGDQILPYESIVPLIDELHRHFSAVTVVLFGSRTSGRARRYSDFDIGIFSSTGVLHADFRKIKRFCENWAEDKAFFVDVTNLSEASDEFLANIAKSWKFLVGKQSDWLNLQKKVLL